jgi:hypothetical protein
MRTDPPVVGHEGVDEVQSEPVARDGGRHVGLAGERPLDVLGDPGAIVFDPADDRVGLHDDADGRVVAVVVFDGVQEAVVVDRPRTSSARPVAARVSSSNVTSEWVPRASATARSATAATSTGLDSASLDSDRRSV